MARSIIKIPVIHRDSRRVYGKNRRFRIAKLTPLFRRRLFRWLYEDIFEKLDIDAKNKFQKRIFDLGNSSEILADFLLYLEDNGQLERFLAHLIVPFESSAADYDIEEICSFLEHNVMPAKEAEIIAAFFMQTAVADLAMALQYLKKSIKIKLAEMGRS